MPTYTNPIIPGFNPDPSICRVGEDYYLVTSSFEFFPGVPLYHSTNLVDWEQLGYVLTRESQLPLQGCRPSGGIFAPTLRHHDGRFYMITTNTHPTDKPAGNFYVWTDDIHAEWSDPVWLEMGGIDPDLFFDDDGSVWFTSTDGQRQIDLETGTFLGEPITRWPGTPDSASPEGPHIYKINGTYYTMLAEGGTEPGHMVTIARSDQLGGPFEPCPHNPILTQRSKKGRVMSTGHADMVQDPNGNWWMVFLGVRKLDYPSLHLLGRETFLAPVTWTEEGWPVVNEGKILTFEVDTPLLPEQKPAWTTWADDFAATELKREWNFIRNPNPDNWSLTESPGQLTLHCSRIGLDDWESPAWIGRRLQHFSTQQLVTLDFIPEDDDEEAGMSLFLQSQTHNDLLITGRNGRRVAVVRRVLGTMRMCSDAVPLPDSPVTLSIITGRTWMDLGMITEGGHVSLMKAETRFLTTEIGGAFTGLFVSLFAKGRQDGSSHGNIARFSNYKYKVWRRQ
jgi:xylan 1,4-beta-xylosidase